MLDGLRTKKQGGMMSTVIKAARPALVYGLRGKKCDAAPRIAVDLACERLVRDLRLARDRGRLDVAMVDALHAALRRMTR